MTSLGVMASAQIFVNEGFEVTALPAGWASTTTGTGTTSTPSGYGTEAGTVCEGSKAVYKNIYKLVFSGWNLTYTSAVSNGTALNYSFKYLAKPYNTSNVVEGTVSADYSIDGGTTWVDILAPVVLNSPTNPIPCTTVSGTIPAGTIPVGADFRFRLKSTSSTTADFYMGFDDVKLSQVLSNPPVCTTVSAPAAAATAVSVTPTITWASAAYTTGYTLNLGTTPGGTEIINGLDVGNVTSYVVPAANTLNYSTQYYVTVIPKNNIGSASGCTSSSFTTRVIPCPSVSAPTSSATGTSLTPAFTWSAVTGATGYKLSIGTTAGGTDILNNSDLGNVLTYTYSLTPALNYNTKYYYTLNSYSASSNSTGCTERNFTTKTLCPTVTAPSSNSTGASLTPTFTWTANSDATGYRISIGTSAGATDILNNVDVGNVLTYTLPISLAYGVKYFYTINAYNATATSVGCTERSFTTLTLCPTVSAPSSNAVGVSVTPTFTWAAVNNVTGYRISIGTTSGGTDVLNLFDVGNILTYTLPTPLNNSTQYYYTIVGYIGTQVSVGCSERGFFTVCSSVNVPYTLDFESVTTPSLPLCTAVLNAGSGNAWKTATAPTGVGFNTGKALNYSFNSSNAANAWFFTQGINLTAGVSYRIKYKYANSTGTNQFLEKLKVAYGSAATVAGMTNVLATHETTAGAPALPTGTTISSANPTGGFYTLGNATSNFVDFTPTSTGVYYFGFNAYSIKDMNQIYVDDINIDVTPTCFEPTAVAVASITTSSANVSWTAPSVVPGNGYEVYYSTSNIVPTASTVLNAANSITSASTSASINGLSPATTYYAWVRSVCSSTDKSIWSISVIFTTSCVSVTTLNENFDTTAVGSLPPCWTSIGSTLTYAAVNASSSMSAPNVLYIYTSGTSTGMVSTPIISTLSTGNYSVAFKGRANSTAGGVVQIGYLTDPALTSSFVSLGSYTATSTTVVDNFILPITGVPSGVTSLVLKHTGTPSYSVYIDDFRYDLTSILSASEANSVKVNNIKVYPNPFADVLNISDVSNVKSISVVDISGKLVKTFDKPESTLHLGGLNSGMYLVVLNMKDGSRQTIKAIKK